MKPKLVCRASNKGVLIFGRQNRFYPKVLRGKYPAKTMTEDEVFIKHCLCGIKHLTPEELREMGEEEVQAIIALNKKAMTKIVRLKEEIARDWTTSFLRPLLHNDMAQQLVIDDARELYLDIDIPRGILITELMKLK